MYPDIMGVMFDCTEQDRACVNVEICFTFERRGTRKTIDTIAEQRHVTDEEFKALMRSEADRMAQQGTLLKDEKGVYRFTKHGDGSYSWEPAGMKGRAEYLIKRYF